MIVAEFLPVLFLRRRCPLALFRGSMCTDGKSLKLTHFYLPLKNSWWRRRADDDRRKRRTKCVPKLSYEIWTKLKISSELEMETVP